MSGWQISLLRAEGDGDDYVENVDGSWMGPYEGQEDMALDEVLAAIRELVRWRDGVEVSETFTDAQLDRMLDSV